MPYRWKRYMDISKGGHSLEEDMTRQIPQNRMIHEEITSSWAIQENGDEYQEGTQRNGTSLIMFYAYHRTSCRAACIVAHSSAPPVVMM